MSTIVKVLALPKTSETTSFRPPCPLVGMAILSFLELNASTSNYLKSKLDIELKKGN
jgi:hypothetical protein